MNGLIFSISAELGMFTQPDTNDNPLSYEIPPKSSVLGMMAAIAGVDKNDFAQQLPGLLEKTTYSVQVNSVEICSSTFNGISPSRLLDQIWEMSLENPSYRIALDFAKRFDWMDTFFRNAERGSAVYRPSMGRKRCPLSTWSVMRGDFKKANASFMTRGFAQSMDMVHNPEVLRGTYMHVGRHQNGAYADVKFVLYSTQEIKHKKCQHTVFEDGSAWLMI